MSLRLDEAEIYLTALEKIVGGKPKYHGICNCYGCQSYEIAFKAIMDANPGPANPAQLELPGVV